MENRDPNIAILELVAGHLGDLTNDVVFVGGAVAGLLITDAAMPMIRPTDDVDLVVRAVVLNEYHAIEEALKAAGFRQDAESDVICRWKINGVSVDVMPMDKAVLGFANQWYPMALETAEKYVLKNGVAINLITAPVFIATKLDAFAGRGKGDYLFSHDIGDLIAVVDGREGLLDECYMQSIALREYLGAQFTALFKDQSFTDALSGHLQPDAASQARLPMLIERLRALASLS